MKRKALTLLLCLMVLGMNAERNFITDAAYRGQVKQAYTKKLAQIALQHHGTSPVNYFYYKAQKITEGNLADDEYCYDGPKPQTKIAAIIMICDTIEAAARAVSPDSREQLMDLIDNLVKDKLDHGQFDECSITMNDIRLIKETIADILPSVNHARIKYKK